LPDGIFSNRNPNLGKILEELAMEVPSWEEYFMTIWSILRPFGIFFYVLVCCPKKNLATLVWGLERNRHNNVHFFRGT
jgi:hypothetical protein